LVLTHF